MSADMQDRTSIAADLLCCEPDDVRSRVRAMTPSGVASLTSRIDGVLAWVADYEAAETHTKAEGEAV